MLDSLGRKVLVATVVVLAAAAGLIMLLSLMAHAMIYHPRSYPANYRKWFLPGMVELSFQSEAGQQCAFYIPPRRGVPLGQLWVVFSGNGSLALDWLPFLARDTSAGDAFLLIDYPSYGKSEGSPNAAKTRAAATDALASLASHLKLPVPELERRLNVMGHSLGAAAALDFVSHHPVGKVILFSPFTSLRDEAAAFGGRWLSHLVPNEYDNRAALRVLARRKPLPQVTIFHGLEDTMISPHMGQELAAEFPGFVRFHGVPNAGHDNVILTAEDEVLVVLGNASF